MSVVVEPFVAGWTLARRRAEYIFRYRSLQGGATCFVCSDKATEQHHVVLLKHGGTNDPRNRVPICRFCHEHIHDWMDAAETVKRVEAEMRQEDQHYRALVRPEKILCQTP
jgi:hypothetical protein